MARILQIDQFLTNLIHPVYNVKDDFNAVGDGVADDAAAIQAAVDAVPAAGGWVVGNPADTYLVKAPIQLKSNVKIVGMKFKVGTTFVIPPGALNGRGGPLELDDFGTTTTAIENVIIRDCSFDLTAATDTNISAINQADRPVQHLLIEDCSFDLPGANIAPIILQELGASATVPSFDITIRHLYVHNGAGIQLYLNAVAATSSYRDVLIDDIVSLIDLNGVGDDRVAIVGNFPAGGGTAEVKGITVRCVYTSVGSAVTTGTVHGVKFDPGTNSAIYDFTIRDVYFYSNTTIKGYPVVMLAGSAGFLQNYVVDGVYGDKCYGIRCMAQRFKPGPYYTVRNIAITNLIDTLPSQPAGIEVFAPGGGSSDEVLVIDGFSLNFLNAPGAGNTPVGVMLTGGAAGQGITGVTTIRNGNIQSPRHGISNNILEDGTTAALSWTNIYIENVRASVYVAWGSFVNKVIRRDNTFQPEGVAAITVGASPFTYTNDDNVPEGVYIDGGTVSDIAKNAITVYTSTGKTVWLEPGEAVTVTYSVLPTMNKDRK